MQITSRYFDFIFFLAELKPGCKSNKYLPWNKAIFQFFQFLHFEYSWLNLLFIRTTHNLVLQRKTVSSFIQRPLSLPVRPVLMISEDPSKTDKRLKYQRLLICLCSLTAETMPVTLATFVIWTCFFFHLEKR